MHINLVTADDLEKAMENPEKYGHIGVRVSGFFARFVALKKEIQKEIIARTRHTSF